MCGFTRTRTVSSLPQVEGLILFLNLICVGYPKSEKKIFDLIETPEIHGFLKTFMFIFITNKLNLPDASKYAKLIIIEFNEFKVLVLWLNLTIVYVILDDSFY